MSMVDVLADHFLRWHDLPGPDPYWGEWRCACGEKFALVVSAIEHQAAALAAAGLGSVARARVDELTAAASDFEVIPNPYEGGVTGWLRRRAAAVRSTGARRSSVRQEVPAAVDAYRLLDGRVVFVDKADRTRLLPSGEPTLLREDTDTATALVLVAELPREAFDPDAALAVLDRLAAAEATVSRVWRLAEPFVGEPGTYAHYAVPLDDDVHLAVLLEDLRAALADPQEGGARDV